MIPNMAQILCDGTEGSFLQKTNELLETNGFNKMPFTKAQLSNNTPIRKDPNIEIKIPENGKAKKKKKRKKRNTGKAPSSDESEEEKSHYEEESSDEENLVDENVEKKGIKERT